MDMHDNSTLTAGPVGGAPVLDLMQLRHDHVMKVLGLGDFPPPDRDRIVTGHRANLARQTVAATYAIDDVSIDCPPNVYHCSSGSSSPFVVRHLVDEMLPSPPSILEVGCGSGAILLALARRFGAGRYLGVDIAEDAVVTSRRNADTNGIAAEFRHSDLFSGVGDERFDMIVFAPPFYDKVPVLSLEATMMCDPGGALLERFLDEVRRYLRPKGAAFIAISNIGMNAPLDRRDLGLQLQGAELFASGFLRAVARVAAI